MTREEENKKTCPLLALTEWEKVAYSAAKDAIKRLGRQTIDISELYQNELADHTGDFNFVRTYKALAHKGVINLTILGGGHGDHHISIN